jgi:hypothetical protein
VGHRAEASGLKSLGRACLARLRSRGQPTGLISTSPSQHRKCQADLNVRAPNLLRLPGSTRLLELGCWQCQLEGTMALVLRRCTALGLSSWALSPVGGARQTHRRLAGSNGSQALPWTTATMGYNFMLLRGEPRGVIPSTTPQEGD